MTYSSFDDLRLPAEKLAGRRDRAWEWDDNGADHRNRVLHALVEAMVQMKVAAYTFGEGAADDPEFQRGFVDPLWDELSACLTRQDLLRWLVEWAGHSAEGRALRQIRRLQEDLNSLTGI